MSTGPSLGSRIVAADMRIQRLLTESAIVGGIYTMGYDECLVGLSPFKQQSNCSTRVRS